MPPNRSGTGPMSSMAAELPQLNDPVSQTASLDHEEAVLKQIPLEDEVSPLLDERRQLLSWRRYVGVGLMAVAVITGALLFIAIGNKPQQTNITEASTQIKVQGIALPGLSQQLSNHTTEPLSSLTVNGQIKVDNSLVLQPSATPSSPTAGQLFYNQTTNQLGYYDGKGFVYLNGAGSSTTNNYTTINNITNAAPITNVTNITQGSSLSAVNGTAGTIALFNNANTLGNSGITQSGTTINVGGTTNNLNGSTINVGTAGSSTVSVGSTGGTSTTSLQGGLGGITISTGGAAGSSGNITIESGASTGTSAGNVTLDTGNGFVSGTVILNSTFESGLNNMASWIPNASAVTLAQNCTIAHTGNCSLSLSGPAFWGIQNNGNGTVSTPVTAGHHYFISAYVRAASTTTQIAGALMWNVGSFNSHFLSFPTTTTSAAAWTQMSASGIAPAGATQAVFRFNGTGGSSNGTQFIDDVTITDLSSGTSSSELDLGATNAQTVTIGNMNEVGPTTINGGSGITLNSGEANISVNGGAINITGDGASSFTTSGGPLTLGADGGGSDGVVVTTQANSTSAFSVQRAGGLTTLFNIDSTNNAVSLGTGAGTSIGYTSVGPIGGAGSGVGNIVGSKVSSGGGGSITSISAYIGASGILTSPNNKYQFALYADNGSGTAPGNYIASSAIGTLGSSAGWYTLPISATLTPSTTYWLVYWQNSNQNDSNNGFSFKSSVAGSLLVAGSSTWQSGPNNGLPTAFPGLSSSFTNLGSIYASYAASGPALTINQFGTMAENGAVLLQDPTNSTVAFQVQDNLGNALLVANTADKIVAVGGALTVSGSITVSGHIITGGTTPSIAAKAGACTGGTASITGTDTTGTITINTGTSCPSGGTLATITFAQSFGANPTIVLTPGSPISQTLGAYVDDSTISPTAFDLGTNATPSASQTFKWNYVVIQ